MKASTIYIRLQNFERYDHDSVSAALRELENGGPAARKLDDAFVWASLGDCGNRRFLDVYSDGILADRISLLFVYDVLSKMAVSGGKTSIKAELGESDFDASAYEREEIYITTHHSELVTTSACVVLKDVLSNTYTPQQVHVDALTYGCGALSVLKSLESDWTKLLDVDHYNLRAYLQAVLKGDNRYIMLVVSENDVAKDDDVPVSNLWKF